MTTELPRSERHMTKITEICFRKPSRITVHFEEHRGSYIEADCRLCYSMDEVEHFIRNADTSTARRSVHPDCKTKVLPTGFARN